MTPLFPISAFVAAAQVFLILRGLWMQTMPRMLMALLGLTAWQSLLIALVQLDLAGPLRAVQPVTAALIPPLAWMALARMRTSERPGWAAALHLVPMLAVIASLLTVHVALDALLIVQFAGYGVAMLVVLGRGADDLGRARLGDGAQSVLIWRLIAGFMILSALSDVLIVVDILRTGGVWKGWIVSFFSSLTLLGLGLLSVQQGAGAPEPEGGLAPETTPEPSASEADAELVARLHDRLRSARDYRDPDLTLVRLARRLQVPAKVLSGAINRVEGQNVSRLINGYRVAEVCGRLEAGEGSITQAMLGSGFMTKSNFNREFRRVMGQSPSEWVAQGGGEVSS